MKKLFPAEWTLGGIALALVVAPIGPGARAQHTSLTTATCPICTDAQKGAWLAAHDSTIRIRPRDVLGHRIGLNRANTYSGNAKYRPIRHDKQVGCGRFVSFGLYTNDKGEWDWNLRVRPTAYSRPMHDEIRAMTPAEKLQEWPCNGDCFKGEITTDNQFRDNPYFNVDVPYITVDFMGFEIPIAPDVSQATSILTTNDTLCMYGPWVQDLGHSDHPEIHPSEIVWWRDRSTGAIYALILQDDSNRFDRFGDFRMDDQPNWSRPWSAFPRWTELRVAFAADPTASTPGLITVDGLEAHRILTGWNAVASSDGGGSAHDLVFNGTTVMKVTELESPRDRIGTRYVDVCRLATPEGELIIGYVSFQTVIGDHDRGDGGDARDEGFYVLKITVDEPVTAPTIAVDFRGVLNDLRRWRVALSAADSQRRLVPVADRAAARARDPRFRLVMSGLTARGTGSRASLNRRRTAAGAPVVTQGVVQLNARPTSRLPLLHGGRAVLRDGQDSLVVRFPAHALSATVVRDSAISVAPDPQAATTVRTSLRAPADTVDLMSRIERVRRRLVEIAPEYIARDTAFEGDDSPVADVLNVPIHAAARGNAAELLRIFGSRQPFTITWSFSARNLQTGDTVSVIRGPATAGRIAVEVVNGGFTSSVLTVHMPAAGVYELRAVAQIRDREGVRGTFSHSIPSHRVTGAP